MGVKKISEILVVNQKNMEILQRGENGTPIIILTGLGCSFDEWHDVITTLSKTNRVVMYHRP